MYLMVAGGIITTLNILTLIASLTPCDRDDKIVAGLSPIVAIAIFAVTIWGAVVVFGKLNEYQTLLKK
jgi:NAD/NADP transhydrogenase beta subunit